MKGPPGRAVLLIVYIRVPGKRAGQGAGPYGKCVGAAALGGLVLPSAARYCPRWPGIAPGGPVPPQYSISPVYTSFASPVRVTPSSV